MLFDFDGYLCPITGFAVLKGCEMFQFDTREAAGLFAAGGFVAPVIETASILVEV